jgi:transcription-repair coupling factor (superfamily II helicase)
MTVLAGLAGLITRDPAVKQALSGSIDTLACPEAARSAVLAAIAQSSGRQTLVVLPTGTAAEHLADDLAGFTDGVELFPAWEMLPFERVSPTVETMGQRLAVIENLDRVKVVVTSVRALLQRLGPGDESHTPRLIIPGQNVDPDELMSWLVTHGYRREDIVEHRGEVSRRGAIIDIFPAVGEVPIRIDLWGDEVDRLVTFDVNDQRTLHGLERAEIVPAREFFVENALRDRARELTAVEPWGREQWERIAEGQIFDGMESWMPWFCEREELLPHRMKEGFSCFLVEPRRIENRGEDIIAEESDLARSLATTWSRDPAQEFPRLHLDLETALESINSRAHNVMRMVAVAEGPHTAQVEAHAWSTTAAGPTALADRVGEYLADKWSITIAVDDKSSIVRITDAMKNNGLEVADPSAAITEPGLHVIEFSLGAGAAFSAAKTAILAEADLSGRRRRARRVSQRSSASIFEDLKPGDYVVHQHHGVGQYEGMVTRAIGGVERDYLLIAYKGADKLYVPTDQIDTVRQYIGGEAPAVNKLGGADFARTKSRVASAVRAIAQELVVLYQKRVNAVGHAYGGDTPWQREMEERFPYLETRDQLRAIGDVKDDMERPHPMDRLICGDVGFGKTEVAIRAAFKAVQDGKQVAVLVPTTLLATQHMNTFTDRFAGYPIRVEVLSRFLTSAQAKKVIAQLATGEIDVIVGTHRLLQDTVKFKDLGLLIVDEEQRFGVQHKEAMKKLRTDVDVLTLSATPIPRTLEMSLVGIRDLSLLQTPPADRQPILTFVGEYDERVAVEAIRRELLREGQVFWVHNRVRSIETFAAELRELVPEARIAVAHGQMDETKLEQVVLDFWEGNFDVLVCTTIIESGIDMPAVNTLVVERADLLGLGQMHQLRGRVGRSNSRAYAYLFHPRDKRLTEEAYERLRTIGEATDLGSGFKIAMRDLEIRGAGNLLGESQSGHIAAVGYDLYCQMVNDAVAEMKGEEPPARDIITLDVPADAFLPVDYIPREEMRLEAYRRLMAVTSHNDVRDIRMEWEDRFGPIPDAATALLKVASLRAECHRLGLRELTVTGLRVRMGPIHLLGSEKMRLMRLSKSAVHREETGLLTLDIPKGANSVEFLLGFLADLRPVEDD